MYENKSETPVYADADGRLVPEGSPYAAVLVVGVDPISNDKAEKLIRQYEGLDKVLVLQKTEETKARLSSSPSSRSGQDGDAVVATTQDLSVSVPPGTIGGGDPTPDRISVGRGTSLTVAGLDSAVALDWALDRLYNDPRRGQFVSVVTRRDPLPKGTDLQTKPGMIVSLQAVAPPQEPVFDGLRASTFSEVVILVRAIGEGNSDVKQKRAIRWAITVLDGRSSETTDDGQIFGCRKYLDPVIAPEEDGDVTWRTVGTTFRIWARDEAFLSI